MRCKIPISTVIVMCSWTMSILLSTKMRHLFFLHTWFSWHLWPLAMLQSSYGWPNNSNHILYSNKVHFPFNSYWQTHRHTTPYTNTNIRINIYEEENWSAVRKWCKEIAIANDWRKQFIHLMELIFNFLLSNALPTAQRMLKEKRRSMGAKPRVESNRFCDIRAHIATAVWAEWDV